MSRTGFLIQAVAFDMDGLMFNTEDVYFRSGTLLLESNGHIYTRELCDSIMGCTPQQAFETMIAYCHLNMTWRELQAESEELFISLLDKYLAPLPGLMELLAFLEEHQIPRAVCTSSSRRVMENILRRFQLESHFAFTLTANELEHGKPHPEIYLRAAERFGISPANMLVLEDSQNGCRAGANAEAFVVAVPGEHSRHMDFSMARMKAASLADSCIYSLLESPEP